MRLPSKLSAFVLLVACVSACTVQEVSAQQPSDASASGEGSDPAGASLPTELHAVWLDRWSTSMGYSLATHAYDFETGVWFEGKPDLWDMAPYRGFGIVFGEGDSFLWVRGEDGGVGGCQSYAVEVIKGTASAMDESTLRFHVTARRQRYESTCDPSLNYDRDMSLGSFDMSYTLGATVDTGSPTLTLSDESGSFVYFTN